MKYAVIMPAVAICLTAAFPASAAVTINNAPGAIQPAENVLLPGGQSGSTVFGSTNQSATSVTFHALNNDTLQTNANGQARISASDGSLATVEFFLTDPLKVFKEFEFNLFKSVEGLQSVTIFYNGSPNGSTVFSNSVGTGENFYSGKATGTDYFSKISFSTSNVGVTDLRQVRLGGVGPLAQALPEPATWLLMMIGFAGIGFAMRKRNGAVTTRVRYA